MHTRLTVLLAEKGDNVYNVNPEATVTEAVRLMNQKGVGSVLVMSDDKVVGIFTERDVLRRIVDAGRDAATTPVKDVMTANCVVVGPKTTVGETMAIITEKRVRHLPVVEGGRLLGMLSIGDLTRWVVRNQRTEINELVGYITGRYPG